MSKKTLAQAGAVIKGVFFIGFSIQIILGIVWMCCNFMHVQDFAAPDTTLYGGLFCLLGECPQIMYLLQLVVALGTSYFFMQSVTSEGKRMTLWRSLALLTFPFAMQCHLALQPHSFVGSLFLLMLAFVIRGIKGKRDWWLGILCFVLLIGVTGVVDRESRAELEAKGLAGYMASRMSWSTLINDASYWPVELQEITEEVHFDATISPQDMDLLLDTIREAVGVEKAKEYYAVIARKGWDLRRPVVIRQMLWDVLGYTVSPVIVPMQLDGEAYDSYTGRNYENMRAATPVLTRNYVDYSCWWFVVALVLCVVESAVRLPDHWLANEAAEVVQTGKKIRRKNIIAVIVCIAVSFVWVAVLTLRGAGMMDYKWTIAINQLWLVWAMLPVNGECSSLQECKGE